jgi:hypothetical protein
MNQLLELKIYRQPHGNIIRLERYARDCQRVVNNHCQEGLYDWAESILSKTIHEWERFEQKIGSERL